MTLPSIAGRAAYVFAEENFDADRIIGPENLSVVDIDRLVAVAMRRFDPDFATQVRPGDVLIGAANFGYGHPHYPPMQAMRHLGIAAVIAESFAPGYWREEMEEGFPQIACPGIVTAVSRWDELTIDFTAGIVHNRTNGRSLPFEPFSPAQMLMLEAGGLNGYLHLRRPA